MKNETDPTVESYRILVVDDDREIRAHVRAIIDRLELPRVHVFEAADETAALDITEAYYVDFVIVDLDLGDLDGGGGFELISSLVRRGSCAKIVMMTHHATSQYLDSIVSKLTSCKQVIDFIKKGDNLRARLPVIVREHVKRFDDSDVVAGGLEFVSELVEKRRPRYLSRRNQLRTSPEQVAVEIDRLCRKAFGTTGQERATRTRVKLAPLDRRGLSASILVKAIVTTEIIGAGHSSDKRDDDKFECVAKIGPAEDSLTEAARYREYVCFGVKLTQRVELLGAAVDQGMGLIVYSFAGGVYGKTLASLDELFRNEPQTAGEVIDDLFRTTSWYSITATPDYIRFHDDQFTEAIELAWKRNTRTLLDLANKYSFLGARDPGTGGELTIRVGQRSLTLPGLEFLGKGWTVREYPFCLVHGDMHGGNVMVELRQVGDPEPRLARECLIDYRSAGPGPRCLDAVALESSIRIAHAESVGGPNAKKGTLGGSELGEKLERVARAYDTESQLYLRLLGPKRGDVPKQQWCQLAEKIIKGLQGSFPDNPVTMDEYLATAMFYVVRQLHYSAHSPIVRIRLCVWLAAIYAQFKPLVDQERA